jgi:hypothetical protein
MTDISTEDDLWKLFSKEPTDHQQRGDGFILWDALNQVLSAKSFGDGTQALDLSNEVRFYHIFSGANLDPALRRVAVVRQSDLRKVGRAMNGFGGDVMVGYLGTTNS